VLNEPAIGLVQKNQIKSEKPWILYKRETRAWLA
jgi:hypothetical protein